MTGVLDRTKAPEVSGLGNFDIPRPSEVTLPNGASLFMLDRGDIPVCRLTACWRAGRADVPSIPALVLASNAMRRGTVSRSEQEIAETLEFNGAWLRCVPQAHASFLTLHSLNKSFGTVLPVIADMMTSAAYPTNVLASQREETAAQLEVKNRKIETKAANLYNRLIYGAETPLARSYTGADVQSVSDEEVRQTYAGLFRGNTPAFFLAGRITDEVANTASEILGQLEFGGSKDQISYSVVPAPDHKADLSERLQVDGSLQTALKMGIPTVAIGHPDFERLRMAVVLLGGYFGSRLMTNIREERGYSYGITAALSGAPECAAVEIVCQTDNRFADNVIEEIGKELRRLADEPVPQEELEAARSILVSSMAGIIDTPFSIADYLVTQHALGLPQSYFRQQLETARSVTPEEINRLAKTYLAEAPRLTALAGDFKQSIK